MPYLDDYPGDWQRYMAEACDSRLLGSSAGRRAATKFDPLLFALVYLRKHLKSPETNDVTSVADCHLAWCRDAMMLTRRNLGEAEWRTANIAPRGAGKSTWWFLILPLWAMAHRHRKYIAAFADSGAQAEQHLMSLKRELDNNALLAKDFTRLVKPAKRKSGVTVADSKGLYIADCDVAFMAKGIDSSTLGSKIGEVRPDWLIFDDVEPDESNYSAYQKSKRLHTITHAAFPMNTRAAVTFVGTVQMPGAIMHDLVRVATEPNADDLDEWVREQFVKTRYFRPILDDGSGGLVSFWQERYPIEWMLSFIDPSEHKAHGDSPCLCARICDTSAFRLNFANDPMGRDGGYWTESDFRYEEPDESYTRWMLQVDPAVTTKVTSDYTGLAVVAYSPSLKRCIVVDAWRVKLAGARLRKRCLQIIEQYPRITGVRVETQNGGEYVADAFHDLPVPFKHHGATVSKDVRFSWALDHYQRRRVSHAKKLRACQEEMIGYPKAAYDDIADAASTGVLYFLSRPKPLTVTVTTQRYA